jgi:hypothetical protein
MSIVATLARRVTERAPSKAHNERDLVHFFEATPQGIAVESDGLPEVPFGEFLVEKRWITRYQLFRAMQMQDRHPAVRIGECVAALGYMQISEVERAFARFRHLPVVDAA